VGLDCIDSLRRGHSSVVCGILVLTLRPASTSFLSVTSREQLAARSDQVDALVLSAFERTHPCVTVVAVGGYGRRELFPYSDVDLLLLADAPPEGDARNAVAELLRTLWDDGLRVSQSVRTVRECCEIHEGNLELTISLLDQRFLAGDRARFDQLAAQFPKFLHAQRSAIAKHLCAMTRGRHAKYGGTIYHLEPNVKEHPGGLRDIHVMHWLDRLKESQPEALGKERDFLFGVRIFLHRHFQRDNNLLTFDAQEALAEQPAAWMRAYYRNAREIFRSVTRGMEASENAGSKLLAQFRDWRSRLSTEDFTVSREQVLLRRPQQLYADKSLVMRLMQFVSRHQFRLAWDTEHRIRLAQSEGAPFEAAWDDWRQLLRQSHASAGLRAMQETGTLARFIPEWERIDCLVTRDFYHRYTVDEHTLVTIQSLEDLAQTSDPLRRRFADLLTEIDQPELLRLALLLHDIGKGGGTGEHAAESVRIASHALRRLGVPEEAGGVILFLIEHHLDLTSVIGSRDLADPSTARFMAECAGTIERLKLLTLLTYADISAVNPTAMTPWRMEQLWSAYLAGYEELTRELDAGRIHGPRLEGELAGFVEGFPVRYLRTHSEAEMRSHVALAAAVDSHGTGTNLECLEGGYRLTLITQDRPALLASVSGALAGFGMNILKAEAFSNARGVCLDTFTFSDPHRTLELNPTESGRLCDTVRRAVQGKLDVEGLLQKRRRPPAASSGTRTQPAVSFNNAVSETATLIEIVAEDRPGLLHDLARTISAAACNIEVVLIDTEAHKALDVFYVTRAGTKLAEELQAPLKEALLAACSG
jgi:[protein-PII] uridylyltransferase